MEHIKAEMEKNKGNSNIQRIGQFVLNQLAAHPEDSAKISTDKTLAKSMEAVIKVAKTKAQNNCAMLEDQEVFGIVANYFDITGSMPAATPTTPVEAIPVKEPRPVSNTSLDISFDDLF